MILAQVTNPPTIPTVPFADQWPIVALMFFVVAFFGLSIWKAGTYVWSEYKISLDKSRAFQAEQNKEQREVLKQITDQLTKSQCESTDAIGEMAREFRIVQQGVTANGGKLDIIIDQTKTYNGDDRRTRPRPWGTQM